MAGLGVACGQSRRRSWRNRVTQIILGTRAVTGDTALRLGHWFQTSAQFWLNLQAAYDLRVAAEEVGGEVEALPTKPRARAEAQPKQLGVLRNPVDRNG